MLERQINPRSKPHQHAFRRLADRNPHKKDNSVFSKLLNLFTERLLCLTRRNYDPGDPRTTLLHRKPPLQLRVRTHSLPMSEPSAPPPPPPPELPGTGKPDEEPSLTEATKKKSRLQWDEDNLISNAQEMERAGPRMKIDEPKTPYVCSETGSSTSGSAHQSPPESPYFLPTDQLHGFGTLEDSMRGGRDPGASSDGASSVGSAGRTVHIDDAAFSSGGSSPKSRELFAARRKAHYRNEARLGKAFLMAHALDEDNQDADDESNGGMNGHANGFVEHAGENGVVTEVEDVTRSRLARLNGHVEDGDEVDDVVRSSGDDDD